MSPSALRVDQTIRDYFRRLSKASSDEEIGATLASIGALFDLPHLQIRHSHMKDGKMVKEAIFRSPHTPKRVLKALTRHPMIKTACEVNAPLSLSDTDRLLAARGVKRSRELAGVVGLGLNVKSAKHGTLHAAFFGRHGTENGLARSLLLFAACAAAERRTNRPQPTPSTRPLTGREQEVLDHALNGRTDAEIAAALGIATRTVRFHLVNAMQRAGVTTRAQLIALAARANGTGLAS